MKIAKYKFNTKEQFQDKFDNLHTTDEDGNLIPNFRFAVVQLGHVVLVDGTYDENGDVLTETEYSEEYLVDVTWFLKDEFDEDGNLLEKDHPYGWKSYSVDSKITEGQGMHQFLGVDYQKYKF